MACEVQPLKVVFTYSTYSTCVSAFLFRAIQSIQTFWNGGRFWHFLEEVSVSFPCLLWTLACGAPRSAVSYIHMNMICHRDLKPENFLISKKCAIQVSPALFRMGDGFGKVKHGETWWKCLPDLPGWEGETHRLWNCEALRSGPLDHQGLVTPDLWLWWLVAHRQVCTVHYVAPEVLKKSDILSPCLLKEQVSKVFDLSHKKCCCFRELDWI